MFNIHKQKLISFEGEELYEEQRTKSGNRRNQAAFRI